MSRSPIICPCPVPCAAQALALSLFDCTYNAVALKALQAFHCTRMEVYNDDLTASVGQMVWGLVVPVSSVLCCMLSPQVQRPPYPAAILTAAPHIECLTSAHLQIALPAAIALAVYGVAIPLLCARHILHAHRTGQLDKAKTLGALGGLRWGCAARAGVSGCMGECR